jgi:hypothetical protein
MSLPDYAVDFRGRPACPCQAEWIPAFEHELQRRGVIAGQVPIAQLIGGFSGSGGTHTGGGVSDFWLLGVQGEVAVMVARQMGADATWHRLPGWDDGGGSEHVHSVLRGCPHLSSSARAQIAAVDLGGDGLVGSIPDPGPRPLSGRTWQQGLTWAEEEELMASAEEKIRQIVREELRDLAETAMVRNPSDPKGDPWPLRRYLIDLWKGRA